MTTVLTPQELLDFPLPPNDSEAATVRGYFAALLATLWDEKEGFSGKRPFGNSGWECDLYAPMVEAGIVDGEIDDDGYLVSVDDDAADALLLAAIHELGGDGAEPVAIAVATAYQPEPGESIPAPG